METGISGGSGSGRRPARHANEAVRALAERVRHGFFLGAQRLRVGDQALQILVAALIGALAALGTVGFLALIGVAETLFFGKLFPAIGGRSWLIFLLPALGGLLLAPLVRYFRTETDWDGIPSAMEAVALRGGMIRFPTVAARTVAAVVTIGSGGSAGRFAPGAHLGAAIGSWVGQLLRVSGERMRGLVACGAAGAIAGVFNAPIAGVFFALEVLLGDFSAQTFAPIVVSAVAATAVSRIFLGDMVLISGAPHVVLASVHQIALCAFLGVACGAAATLFLRTMDSAEKRFASSAIPAWLRAAAGGAMTGLIAVLFPQVLGTDMESLDAAAHGAFPWLLALWIAFLKITATSLTLGSGASGGIVGPALFIGGMIGAAAGSLFSAWLPQHAGTAGGYALVGMSAFLAPVIGAPLTATMLLFEITGSYAVILPLLAAVMASMLVAGRFSRFSLYTWKLHERGVDLVHGREEGVLKTLRVRDLMSPDTHTVAPGATFRELTARFLQDPVDYLYLTGDGAELTGVVSFTDIRPHLKDDGLEPLVLARDIATMHPVAVTPEESVYDALIKFGYGNVSQLPVVSDPHSRRLVGVIHRKEILEAYQKKIVSGMRRDRTAENPRD